VSGRQELSWEEVRGGGKCWGCEGGEDGIGGQGGAMVLIRIGNMGVWGLEWGGEGKRVEYPSEGDNQSIMETTLVVISAPIATTTRGAIKTTAEKGKR